MNYPNGKRSSIQNNAPRGKKKTDFSNRGMSLEEDINVTNEYYLQAGVAVVHKKPTPVQIVQVDYPKRSAAVIKEAYFKQASTTDFNGVYRGKYIDFEAKETKNKTSFPLSNVHQHQVDHMKSVQEHGGLCFMIIRFTPLDETYLLPSSSMILYWEDQWNGGRKSIPYPYIVKEGIQIPFHYQARVNYITAIDKLYF
ncbi:recombination protein U [Halobacillus karajensis]|uniref:Holliday junction resolvase RecU n=1 Tax=Halobacillus karajensis TaxID=195088 RepID=A0A024P275_9BACI|nr:Holliday junction resolvase RecU [Halobacillus karajensis]CDQ19534.1 Holliday junction resolvase RecU [Halobacillus karajensis]CDQ21996.1 Holliday junction resolvase RecU [Halobacillus karajensis]CDQ27837.1 Holliday junction resolvase RecU [Halobacillus karajensis]SEH80692.1 recombination protein U [Halobacillus karajensis]